MSSEYTILPSISVSQFTAPHRRSNTGTNRTFSRSRSSCVKRLSAPNWLASTSSRFSGIDLGPKIAGALHPYTHSLLSAIPRISIGEPLPARIRLVSPAPSPMSTPAGCLFVKRCAYAVARCGAEAPAMRTQPDGRQVACHLVEKGQPMWVSAARSIKE